MRAFDWNTLNLQSAPFRVIASNVFDAPSVDINKADPTRADGVVHLFRKMGGRVITVSGSIRVENDELATDTAIDLLKKKTLSYRGTGELGVVIAGKRRYWTGRATNVTIGRKNTDVSRATYGFQVECEKPYGLDQDGLVPFMPTTVVTSQYASIGTQNDGTYLAAPVTTLGVTSVPGGSATTTITLSNPETNEELQFTLTLKNGDTIQIDCDKRQIFQNTTKIYWSGVFPEWLPEGGLFNYADTLASRNITASGNYMRKWL